MSVKFQLKNGLKVLLIESHKSPVVAVQMWVRTGSADEKKHEAGISHFIEHLVFKGTEKYKVGEIASTVEGSGGELNAYTSFDQTVFYVTISKEFTEVGLDVISEMMGFPRFDPTEIDNEREVVIEEIKRGEDNPGRSASQALFKTAFKKHPYGVPVIGFTENIRKVSVQTLVKYYQSRYVPQNMFLVVAGNFQNAEMKALVNKYFSRFKAYKLRKVTRQKELKQNKTRVVVQQAQFQESFLHMAWKTPGIKHKDMPALDVLALIAGQGDSSRLVQRLRLDQPLVNSIGASHFTPKDAGLFFISSTLNPEQITLALEALKSEIVRLVTEPPTEEELQKAIVNLESEQLYEVETVDGLARKAGQLEFLLNDPNYYKKYLKMASMLRPQDIIKVARKYIIPQTLTLVFQNKKAGAAEKKQIDTWLKQLSKELKKSKPQKPVKAKKIKRTALKLKIQPSLKRPEIDRVVLKSGAVVLLRPSTDTAVISARVVSLGGSRVEEKNLAGISELLSRVWTGGTKNKTEKQIFAELEAKASAISGFSGRNTVGLSLETLAPVQKEVLSLYLELLTESQPTKEILAREQKQQVEQIRNRNDSPAQIAILQFMSKLFKAHPYSNDQLGSPESVLSIKAENIKNYLERVQQGANTTVIVSGGFDKDLWLEQIKSKLETLPHGTKNLKSINHIAPEKEENLFHELQKEQSHVVVGVKGLTLNHPDRHALQVIQSILAGQGGRLFLELRDKASLAYSVAPLRMEGIDTGYFGAYIGCSPDKVPTALRMLHEQFNRLVDEKVSLGEIERSKKYLIGRHDIDLQRTSTIAGSIVFDEVYGLDYNETFKFADHIRAVTAEDIQRVSHKLFSQFWVTSVVGPKNPF